MRGDHLSKHIKTHQHKRAPSSNQPDLAGSNESAESMVSISAEADQSDLSINDTPILEVSQSLPSQD